jgi:SAM-dependent methyltransferase
MKQQLDRMLTRIRAFTRATEPIRSQPGGVPVPPAEIRYRIASREYSEADFLQHGKSLADGFMEELARFGVTPRRILDLGCGCGRIIRHLIARGDVECHGTDTDPVGVRWCQQNLRGGHFAVNDRLPPLPYQDAMFDFIYAHSVFTHIDLPSQLKWLAELRRLTVPGGIVRLTTMGEGGFRGIGDAVPKAAQEEFRATGFVFYTNFLDGVLPDWYQSTFHSTKFGHELFQKHLGEIVEFRPGIPTAEWKDPQDTYIIRVSGPAQ